MDKLAAISVIALFVAVTAAVTDVRERRIPNRLTYPAAIFGILLQAILFGWKGLLSSVLGGLIFGGILLLFYIVHAMGAGDVKLATALGCVVGASASVNLLFAIAIAGGFLACIYMVRARRVLASVSNALIIVAFHARHGLQTHPSANLENPNSVRMPYGLAFAAGTMFWAVSVLWR